MFIAGVAASFLSLLANLFMTDFRLDNRHNAIESKKIELRTNEETNEENIQTAAAAKEERIRAEVMHEKAH